MTEKFHLKRLVPYTRACCNIKKAAKQAKNSIIIKHIGFSLVEMLMALLVASLLMAALAPVITRKLNENVTVEGTLPGVREKLHQIEFGSRECSVIKTDEKDGSSYCEGEFTVPTGINGFVEVVLIGAGGGGSIAPTAGIVEYTRGGETSSFKVPEYVNELEGTLISGGAGGGAGSHEIKNDDYFTPGTYTWTIPDIAQDKIVLVSGCGGGGGGGGQGYGTAGRGGNGGIAYNKPFKVYKPWGHNNYLDVNVAGGGGGGASHGVNANYNATAPGLIGGGGGACASFGNNQYYLPSLNPSWIPALTNGGDVNMTNVTCEMLEQNIGNVDGIVSAQGGEGAKAPEGYPGKFCASPGRGGSYNHGAGGGGGGAAIHHNGIAVHGGGGGGGSTCLACTYGLDLNIYFGGGGGGGAAVNGGGGGGGGGIDGGGGGGAAGEWLGNYSGYDYFALDTLGGAGSQNNPEGRGGNGVRIVGGNGGDGKWSYMHFYTTDGGHTNDAWKSGIFPEDRCHGGAAGQSGQAGALRISYLNHAKGGGGGGGGSTIALAHQPVIPNEVLSVKIGRGGKGGTAGLIQEDGNIKDNYSGEDSWYNTAELGNGVTKIRKSDGSLLFATCHEDSHSCGPIAGSPDGNAYFDIPFYNKIGGTYTISIGNYHLGTETIKNFGEEKENDGWGHVAGNIIPNRTGATVGVGPTGGDGGRISTPWHGTCIPGKGGTKPGEKGTDGSGFGCGGGGGYALADGGSGSGGYARISWNQYWNIATNAYKYAEVGAGGGGAAGNVLKYTLEVQSGETIKIRIGQGGIGGKGIYISSGDDTTKKLINGQKGGDTVFALGDSKREGRAGGGGGGLSPSNDINNSYAVVNGIGGSASTVCEAKGKNVLNIASSCTQGTKGGYPEGNKGGDGKNIVSQLLYGTTGYAGGAGGIAGGNSNGGSGSGYGTGGGGAGLLDVGIVPAAQSTANNSQGGDGAHGKIILRWRE